MLFFTVALDVKASNFEDLATGNDLSIDTYQKLLEEGVLDESINFEDWVDLNTRNLEVLKDSTLKDITPSSTVALQPGDIIVTNDTFALGITGHVGIVINSTTIIHTSGRIDEPYPMRISVAEWHSRYKQSKVIRPNDGALGAVAAMKAIQYFGSSTIPYRITADPTNLNYTYCSELVWYSYWQAGKEFKIYDRALGVYERPQIIAPYDFLQANNVSFNGFKFIDNTW